MCVCVCVCLFTVAMDLFVQGGGVYVDKALLVHRKLQVPTQDVGHRSDISWHNNYPFGGISAKGVHSMCAVRRLLGRLLQAQP